MSEMAVFRHRRAHVLTPAQHRSAVIQKDREARQKRQERATAASSNAPDTQTLVESVLGLRAQTEKLAAIEQRLERMSALAEAGASAQGVAQLTAQSLRSIEVGSRLAGVGGYAPGTDSGQTEPRLKGFR